MDTTELTYPVFEANQVLASGHLNDLFEYLDEHTRLTRANLIGIGIACGLDVTFVAPGTVHLTKGCGVTSQGYLIVEPADLALAYVRSYNLPIEYGYPPFVETGTDPPKTYELWELFPDDDQPGAQLLATKGLVLEDKAVVLFVELRKDGLRNCSPNNCDDRGAEVTATIRRLLIDVTDLKAVIAATSGTATTALGADITEHLQLPDLRMPRFDVPNSGPVAPEEVLHAFQDPFRQNKLVAATAVALTQLYDAFKPLVVDEFPSNPFTSITNRFGFLDATPVTAAQVRFMQHYWDLFDDLLGAYEELRWKGVDLMCACCPPESLFPRHLMAGVLDPVSYDTADFRHHFLPSPAVGDCEDRALEARVLFRRLVAILESFTETPPDKGVRVTPSRWGASLSAKAIPYYYDQNGTPPVFELWDPEKTIRRRANQNLSYRADEYTPAPPAFVTDPLRFDLEPNNFLRIEGHLGKNVQSVLETLLSLKKSHRLPFEVIALRTGAFDENIEVDLRTEECRFQDLETLYEALKSELICSLVKQVQYFYGLPVDDVVGEGPAVATLWLLKTYAPDFVAQPGTIGRWIERVLTWRMGQPKLLAFPVAGAPHLRSQVFALVGAMSELSARLTDDIRHVDFVAFGDSYRNLVDIAKLVDEFRRSGAYDEPGLADRLDDIVFRCRLDPFEALADEYKRRVREAKQAQFLSHFLERHPGVQHKAGVPLGGTFLLAYHELPRPAPAPAPAPGAAPASAPVSDVGGISIGGVGGGGRGKTVQLDEGQARLLEQALARFQYKKQFAEDPDAQYIYMAVTGRKLVSREAVSKAAEPAYLDAIANLPDGTVIADFFLPYECCSDCPAIQYQLPAARLRISTTKGCTNVDGFAEVTVTTEGASGSLSAQVNGGTFEELTGTLVLGAGDYAIVVRDGTGNESSPVAITIPPPLKLGPHETIVDDAAGTYHVVFAVEGGTPPYAAQPGTVVDTAYASPALPVADVLTVQVSDAAGCTVERTFQSGVDPCQLPCGGAAIRSGYRFWLPTARPKFPINEYRAEVRRFVITDPDGNQIDLTAEVNEIVNKAPNSIRTGEFESVVQRWLRAISDLVAGAVGSDQWLRLEYEAPPVTGTTGALFVDRLTCIDMAFELAVTFIQGNRERRFQLAYTARGTVVVEPSADSKFRIPPFGGSMSNKCRPDEPPVPLCDEADLKVEVRRDGVFAEAVVLTAVSSGSDQPVAFQWEVQDGIPSVAGGEEVRLTFEPPEPIEKLVRLTAFTEKGCTVTVERVVNIAKVDG